MAAAVESTSMAEYDVGCVHAVVCAGHHRRRGAGDGIRSRESDGAAAESDATNAADESNAVAAASDEPNAADEPNAVLSAIARSDGGATATATSPANPNATNIASLLCGRGKPAHCEQCRII